ncbi:MAG: mobility-associated LCxxNW protein [Lachnospiraceae bacterium]|jgi:hypothetical protein
MNNRKLNCSYCDIWLNYQVSKVALSEAEELSRANWVEIQHLQDRIIQLETTLRSVGLNIPPEE